MLTMQEVANAVKGKLSGTNTQCQSVSTDSRNIQKDALFVALRGAHFDGHQFVAAAIDKGAAGVLVDTPQDSELPQVVVTDTEQALGQLAGWWRSRFEIPVVAVTGSNGKTTVKEMVGRVLNVNAHTLVSMGNFNNPVGLPLSLFNLDASHRYAVVEIGMNQIGEIKRLASIAKPTCAVITNAGAAHLENLDNVDQVAQEKGSLIGALDETGVAVLNIDSTHFSTWKAMAGGCQVVTFGLSNKADVSATYEALEFGSILQVQTPHGALDIKLQLAGEHNVVNALATIAVGIALDIALDDIKTGLQSMQAVAGRLQLRRHFRGGPLIDDTYNANPNSVAAALSFLANLSGDRRLVFGDMFELGPNGEQFHREVGRLARGCGVGRFYSLGELSATAAQEFGRGARHYRDRNELLKDLGAEIDATTTVLIKGSRGMKMDEIADFLCVSEAQTSSGERAC